MFGLGDLPLTSADTLYHLRSYGPLLLLAMVGATPLPRNAVRRLEGSRVLPWLEPVALCALLRTIDTFRLFEKVNILTGGGPAGTTSTITQYLYTYGIKNLNFGFGSAGAIVMTLLVLILSSFYIKRAIQ